MDQARRRLLGWAALGLATPFLRGAGPARGEAAPASGNPHALLAAKLPGADALSYDGTPNGPVLRIRKGDPIALRLTNRLTEATSLQWHGVRAGNAMAGEFPLLGRPIAPGETADMRFVPPDSGLFWFHPAPVPGLPDQTAAGLRGVLIVEETSPPAVDRDLLLTIGDGAATTVNGAAAPLCGTMLTGGRLRLRLLNASTARIMMLAVEGARPKVVAIDGQPSSLFAPVRDAVPVGPGARFEMLLDAPATEGGVVRLLMRGLSLGEGPRPPDTLLMALTTNGMAREPLPPIAPLPGNPALPPAIPLERSVRADCIIDLASAPAAGAARWRINGTAALEPGPRPLLGVPRGGTVTLGFQNRSSFPVPIRVHGHAMRLLHAKDDGWEPYWRDSVILPPASVNHVAFVADNPGRWLIDSAMFDQAAFGLRTWFEVT